MRNICSGVIWFALISGAIIAVASQVETSGANSLLESAKRSMDGHPKHCLACRHRGQMLPSEIGNDTVWVVTEPGAVVR